ncbi:MAG: DUF4922 domain-containing protein [Bacteroidetes bacterium]|nr:DUF4922 domain-containing protein [Bacteroidota bacterium]
MKHHNLNFEKDVVFTSPDVDDLIKQKNYSDALVILLRNQKLDWNLLSKGFDSLQYIKTKTFQFEGFNIDVQFNPGRIKSTTADVSKSAIDNRECFLCLENIPQEQKGINYKDEYLILCKPYPIFFEHFTIVFRKHFPQRISESFHTFLKLSKRLGKYYSVLYNGPQCGASAPDHLHFQAVNKNSLKILNQMNFLIEEYAEKIIDQRKKVVFGINDWLRKIILIKSKDERFITNVFETLYSSFQKSTNLQSEPMINMISSFDEKDGWQIYIFPRKAHRPKCFYEKGEKKLMISPAVIDFSGTLILPREKDFEKINKNDIRNIFNDVVVGKELFDYLKSHIRKTI